MYGVDCPTRIDIGGQIRPGSSIITDQYSELLSREVSPTLLCFFSHYNQRPPAAGVLFAFILAGGLFFIYINRIKEKGRTDILSNRFCVEHFGFVCSVLSRHRVQNLIFYLKY